MKVDILTYFTQNIGSIIGWALLLFIFTRLIIGFQDYNSTMQQFKAGLGSILFLAVSLIYLISPIDILPDVIPIIGWIDDIVLTLGSVFYAQKALNKIFWGEYPPKSRLRTFLIWYVTFVLFTYALKYVIYLA